MSLNRRQFLSAVSGEFLKELSLMSAGAVAIGSISHVQVEGMATIDARKRAKEAIAAGLDYDEDVLTRIIEREYESNTDSMTVVGAVVGALTGTLLSLRTKNSPAPQKNDLY